MYNAQRMVESEINFWSYQMVTKNTLNANYYLSETSFILPFLGELVLITLYQCYTWERIFLLTIKYFEFQTSINLEIFLQIKYITRENTSLDYTWLRFPVKIRLYLKLLKRIELKFLWTLEVILLFTSYTPRGASFKLSQFETSFKNTLYNGIEVFA